MDRLVGAHEQAALPLRVRGLDHVLAGRQPPGIAARLFGALGEKAVNVIAVAQGSSEANISLALASADADAAVRYIHAAFGLAG